MRLPFRAASNRYMNAYAGVYAEGMYAELSRRYPKIEKQLDLLNDRQVISTTDPQYLTVEDIKQYAIYLRKVQKLKDSSISHDMSALSNLCVYISGNNCVNIARRQYPLLFPRKHRGDILPVIERPDFNRIMDASHQITERSDPLKIRAYAEVVLALCSGMRTGELQHTKMENLDRSFRFIYIDFVKGMNTYGSARTIPIRLEAAHIMEVYLRTRDSSSPYIFPNRSGRYLSENSLGLDRKAVCDDLKIDFDYRKCRRTYGQYLVDEGFSSDEVAVILGHSSSKTTETYYARPRPDRVVRKIIDLWNSNNEMQKGEIL